ncbi:hypothetical protein PS047_19065 [Escherichia albertii]|nr:hypothetical protein [Escherichia albertii]MCU7267865.1 hypothetical protein [Escherichia albertii]MCU7286244.1 hypothetical protein [Escherichia albertii]MCU7323592.1 hypothetical protein [Escherichia albertii]MCZ9072561.1 hypothetical protein [Escherichia albertii]MCZ9121073.1 hypothetical protein [Escherichia albertii]
MTYGEAYLAGWKNIFNYEGVATRFEFWSFMSGSVAICRFYAGGLRQQLTVITVFSFFMRCPFHFS